MLSNRDRVHFPYPAFLHEAGSFTSSTDILADGLKSGSLDTIDPEALANIYKIAKAALSYTNILIDSIPEEIRSAVDAETSNVTRLEDGAA